MWAHYCAGREKERERTREWEREKEREKCRSERKNERKKECVRTEGEVAQDNHSSGLCGLAGHFT